MTTDANTEIHRITWHGRKIEIRYQPRSFAGCAHLEIKCRTARPLPITGTGYRSHFTAREDIEQEGGPVAFVEAWLDIAAQTKAWQRTVKFGHQLSLF